jgi:hypothetical protein
VRVDEARQQQTARHVHHLSSGICPEVRSDPLDDPFSDQDVGRGIQAPRAPAAQQQIRHGLAIQMAISPAADPRVGCCAPGRSARRGIVGNVTVILDTARLPQASEKHALRSALK